MRRFLLVAISAAAISACSEGRERRVLSIDSTLDVPDLTLPDTVTRRDTSAVVATRTEAPVSPVEQQAKPEPPAAKPSKPVRRRSRPAPAPETSVDTSVQAYAPGVPESARPVERLSKAETAVKAGTAVNKPDTLSRSADSTALARDAATTPRDTARSLARDTAAPRVDTAV
ncbi:MAG TPA: hypothetical protein VE399_03995, partial [Gemmatimonadales bacterium]|nr:hypothetical protein [Gemmatimonadales bacterium]